MTDSDQRNTLQLSVAQRSLAGVKPGNEDALGIRLPDSTERHRGAALVIADGVSSADAGRQAAEAAVQGFLSDYYATPDTWSIQSAGERVVTAINHWLHGRGQAHAENQGWLTTFTALVLRGRSAHILHIGDTRVYRLRGDTLELWPSHFEDRAWRLSFFGEELESIHEFDPLTGATAGGTA